MRLKGSYRRLIDLVGKSNNIEGDYRILMELVSSSRFVEKSLTAAFAIN